MVTDFNTKVYSTVSTGLNGVISNKTVDTIHYGHVVGTVTNTTQTTWKFVDLTLALVRDATVIDVSSSYSKPTTPAPG